MKQGWKQQETSVLNGSSELMIMLSKRVLAPISSLSCDTFVRCTREPGVRS